MVSAMAVAMITGSKLAAALAAKCVLKFHAVLRWGPKPRGLKAGDLDRVHGGGRGVAGDLFWRDAQFCVQLFGVNARPV